MKHKYLSTLLLGMFVMGSTTSCDDFLDNNGQPQSDITPAAFFKDVAELSAYSINLYNDALPGIRPDDYGISVFGWDNNTDNQAGQNYSNRWVPGQLRTGDGSSFDFEMIRKCNYFIVKVGERYEKKEIAGAESEIRHYMGEMYVLRALAYFDRLKSYGDFPIVTGLLPDNKDELIAASKRQPRHKVARFILEDLDKAIDLLSVEAPGGKNRISKDVAYLLRSRVALFEGTWLKHHKGTAFVPGGPGWPGKSEDLDGFNIDAEISYFLTEAMKSAKSLGDKLVGNLVENTDTREGMSSSMANINPYYTMFCDVDMNKYSEVLLWRQFSIAEGLTHNIQMQLEDNGGGTGWTRGLVNSFVMRNGLPIYAAGSGYDPEWEKETIEKTLQDRDSRVQIFTKRDGDVEFYTPDGKAINVTYKWILEGNYQTKMITGFPIKKGKHYSQDMQNNHFKGLSGALIYRGTEALLNYMEACVESTGAVDATAKAYWEALRRRAKVDPDYMKTVAVTDMAEEAKWDFGAYSHGKLIDPLLYNVRRERRCEFIGEGMRWDDLLRWRACDQLITTPYIIEGMRYWGSSYEGNLKDSKGEIIETIVDPASGKGNMSDGNVSPYIRPYQISSKNNSVFDGYRFQEAYYLSPLGQATFRQTAAGDQTDLSTSPVYQNPGWSMIAGEAAK